MTGSQIKTLLSKIIDSLVADNSDGLTDDLLVEALEDPEKRSEAVETLLKMIEFNREDL